MIFIETELKGAFVIEPERLEDERGFFARTWCTQEFEAHGLNPNLVQCNISFSKKKGTIRGMHYQAPPYEEAKFIRCTTGAIYDVIIDLRPDSKSFMHWIAVELPAESRKMIYVPEGFAQGCQILMDNTEIYYQMSEFFAPEYARGLRWNDPLFNINWPQKVTTISVKDQNWPDFDPSKIEGIVR
jgi:dTDP-4-dehydrorhamnose 3,5-epimerase